MSIILDRVGRDSFLYDPPEVAFISELPLTKALVKPKYNTIHYETEIPSGEIGLGTIVPKGCPRKSAAQKNIYLWASLTFT